MGFKGITFFQVRRKTVTLRSDHRTNRRVLIVLKARQYLRRFEKENPNTFESRLSRLASSSAVSAPKRSNAMRVRVVSGLGGLNLVKTPFELSRWRGGRYACDTLDIMGCRKVVNRLSPLFTNSLSINLLQAKVN